MHENYFVQNNMIFLVIFYYYWWFACYCIWFQVTGNRLGAILQSVFTIVLAVCGGIYYEWRLGLAGASYVPMLLLSSTFHAKIIASHDNIEKEALARSAKVSSRFYSVFFLFFTFSFFFSWLLRPSRIFAQWLDLAVRKPLCADTSKNWKNLMKRPRKNLTFVASFLALPSPCLSSPMLEQCTMEDI